MGITSQAFPLRARLVAGPLAPGSCMAIFCKSRACSPLCLAGLLYTFSVLPPTPPPSTCRVQTAGARISAKLGLLGVISVLITRDA